MIQTYYVDDSLGKMMPDPDNAGDYVLYTDHLSETQALREALQACVGYMEDDSGGYEVYRAILDSAKNALGSKP